MWHTAVHCTTQQRRAEEREAGDYKNRPEGAKSVKESSSELHPKGGELYKHRPDAVVPAKRQVAIVDSESGWEGAGEVDLR
jgi:hypothetical protein